MQACTGGKAHEKQAAWVRERVLPVAVPAGRARHVHVALCAAQSHVQLESNLKTVRDIAPSSLPLAYLLLTR